MVLSKMVQSKVATVLTVYGIETLASSPTRNMKPVATVLTVYGIETECADEVVDDILTLQQCLPFTVLKLS